VGWLHTAVRGQKEQVVPALQLSWDSALYQFFFQGFKQIGHIDGLDEVSIHLGCECQSFVFFEGIGREGKDWDIGLG